MAAGMRPISNVVDASNYVMVELGKPIHTFDAAAVHGRPDHRPPGASPGERFETLDHVERDLDPETLVIADPRRADRDRRRHGRHRRRRSSRGHDRRRRGVGDLRSGQHPPDRLPLRAPLRREPAVREGPGVAAGAHRGGPDDPPDRPSGPAARPGAGAVDTDPPEPRARARRVPTGPHQPAARDGPRTRRAARRCSARVGIATRAGRARGRRSRSPPEPSPSWSSRRAEVEVLEAVVPTWRRDLAIEADIIEEVARVHGYERVPSILPHTSDAALPARPAGGPRRDPRTRSPAPG